MNIKKILSTVLLALASFATVNAQQPQAPGNPLYPANAQWTNGVAPGYAPTLGIGLNLNLGGGTANCAGTIVTYAANTLVLTANTTNYVYLNTGSNCIPAVKTTSFTSADFPIAEVLTGSSGTLQTCNQNGTTSPVGTSPCIVDVRTLFFEGVGSSNITLTTTGTSGAATLTGGVLNIPNYSFTQTYPGAGVANSTGSAWGTSYTVGTGNNDLVQLNGSAQLPAVSAALLTNLPFESLTTTGTSGAATLSAGVLNIPQYSGGAAGTNSQIQYNNLGVFGGASGGLTNGTHWAFGAGSTIDPTGYYVPDPPASGGLIANFSETNTGTGQNGLLVNLTNNPTSTISGSFYGSVVNNSVNLDGQDNSSFSVYGSTSSVQANGNTTAISTVCGNCAYDEINGTAPIGTLIGLYSEIDGNAAAPIGTIFGFNSNITTGPATVTNAYGGAVGAEIDASGPTTLLEGLNSGGVNVAATLATFRGVDVQYYNVGGTTGESADFYAESPNGASQGGAITDQYGLYIENQSGQSGGTVGTAVGLEIDDQSGAGATQGIDQEGTSDENDFHGPTIFTNDVTLSSISGSTQCLHVNTSGLISGTGADCPTGGVTAVSVATANGFQGTSSGGTTPALTLNVDSSHILPINTGSATLFLNQAGGYSSPAGTGVSSWSGDGSLFNNSSSTGSVTATLANAAANSVWGNCTGLSTTPSYCALVATMFPTSGVSAGSYTNSNITVDTYGRVTSASNGSGGSGGNKVIPWVVQSAIAYDCTAGAPPCATITLTNPVSPGSALVVEWMHTDGTFPPATMTDGQGDTFTLYNQLSLGGEFQVGQYVACGVAGGSTTITSSSGFNIVSAYEVANVAASSCVDGHNAADQATTASPVALGTGSVTTTFANDFIFVSGASRGEYIAAITEGNSYTQAQTSGFIDAALTYTSFYGIAATPGSVSDTVTYTSANAIATMSGILALKPSTAGNAPSGVTPGSYTNMNATVNAQGKITAASNGSSSAGNYVNMGSAVTWTGCTFASGVCTVSGSTTATVTISSIPGTYLNLNLVVVGQLTAGSNEPLRITFNSDSSAHYAFNSLYTATSDTWGNASNDVNFDYMQLGQLNYQHTVTNEYSIPLYAGSTFTKVIKSDVVVEQGVATIPQLQFGTGEWDQTSAITSVSFTITADDFLAGTAFMIYGRN